MGAKRGNVTKEIHGQSEMQVKKIRGAAELGGERMKLKKPELDQMMCSLHMLGGRQGEPTI